MNINLKFNRIINNKKLESKFFLAPINTGFSMNGIPTERLLEFHKLRSGKKIGISYVGNVAIDKEFITNNKTAYFSAKVISNRWNEIAAIIHNQGSLAGVQLGCKLSKIEPIRTFKGYDIGNYLTNANDEFSSYSTSLIKTIISKYINSAVFMYNQGFDVIQIHAAHGYFLSLSLSNVFNSREDKYSSSVQIIKEIIEGIKNKIPNCILDIRISLFEGIFNKETELEQKDVIISQIAEMDIDMISLSNGIYNINKYLIYPELHEGNGIYEKYAIRYAKKYPNVIWNTCGNIYNISSLKGLNISNLTYGICRSLIADPHFVEKSIKGDVHEILQCKRCNRCHYYSKSEESLNGCLTR